jgi:hypothetical protein
MKWRVAEIFSVICPRLILVEPFLSFRALPCCFIDIYGRQPNVDVGGAHLSMTEQGPLFLFLQQSLKFEVNKQVHPPPSQLA